MNNPIREYKSKDRLIKNISGRSLKQILNSETNIPEQVELCKGAQVMLMKVSEMYIHIYKTPTLTSKFLELKYSQKSCEWVNRTYY